MGERLMAMVGITTIVAWAFLALGSIVASQTSATFMLRPSSPRQVGTAIFIIGVSTVVLRPVYWLQKKVVGYVAPSFHYVRTLGVANAYAFCGFILLFLGGLLFGQVLVPVFMVTPGIYLSLWVFSKLGEREGR